MRGIPPCVSRHSRGYTIIFCVATQEGVYPSCVATQQGVYDNLLCRDTGGGIPPMRGVYPLCVATQQGVYDNLRCRDTGGGIPLMRGVYSLHIYVYYYRTYEKAVSGGGRGGKRRTCAVSRHSRGNTIIYCVATQEGVYPPCDGYTPCVSRHSRGYTIIFGVATQEGVYPSNDVATRGGYTPTPRHRQGYTQTF